MASIPSSPSSISFESALASPPSPLAQQQQQQQQKQNDQYAQQQQGGGDGDVVILRAIEKLHLASAALGPEDDNQDDDDEDKAEKEDADSVGSSATSQQEHPTAIGSELQPQQPSVDRFEIDRLTQEKHALAKQMKDVSTQFARQLHALQAQLQQQSAAHDRKEQEWKQHEKLLQKARNDAVDDARRAQAQVQLLEQRVRELEELVPNDNNGNNSSSPDSQLQQTLTASAEPTLHLTQRQSYNHHQQPSGNSTNSSHPHAVQQSVVGSTTRPSSGSHVTCHPQNPRSDFSSTARVTRIGRNRSTPSGSAAASAGAGTRDPSFQTQTQASPTTNGSSSSASMMMPPSPMNPFQWREDASSYESQCTPTSGYRGYSSPPQQQRSSSMLPAPMSVRSTTFYPTQSYNNNNNNNNNSYPQHQSPIGYPQQFSAPPAMGPASPAELALEPTALISICPIPDEATAATSVPQGYGSRLEKKPSSGLLAYCSELLASSVAPAVSVSASVAIAPSVSATGANNPNTVSPNAKVAPAWQLFSSSSSNSTQLAKQTSLDVEQGFSPPRPHQMPLEMQQQQLQHQIQQQQQNRAASLPAAATTTTAQVLLSFSQATKAAPFRRHHSTDASPMFCQRTRSAHPETLWRWRGTLKRPST